MKKSVLTLFLLFILSMVVIPVSAAQPLHMTLLAAQEVNSTLKGSSADLFLEAQSGRGRVFLETFPLTKIDTQISTRFAKEIACHHFDLNCENTDFIYTIRSDSTIVGGPSAGAALATLTTAAVLGLDVNQSVAVTGTINSGGLIGPVGGLQVKIDAAATRGIKKVLLPIGTAVRNIEREGVILSDINDTNGTGSVVQDVDDLIAYGATKGIKVVEVTDLTDVVYHVTGRQLRDDNAVFSIDPEYSTIMSAVSLDLCDRSDEILERVERVGLESDEEEDIVNRTGRAAQAIEEENYYSAASYCFGLNIRLRTMLYEKLNLSDLRVSAKSAQLSRDIERFEEDVRTRVLHTITDLQTFTVVMERLNDATELLDRIETEDNDLFLVAFAEERYFSARSWSRFFEMSGKQYDFDETLLHQSCLIKLQEAREREQYVQFFLPEGIDHIHEGVRHADSLRKEGEYEQCLITASEAKADANAILSIIGVYEEQLPRLLEAKTNAIEHLISRTVESQAFPLLGFSYYQYAQSLEQYDIHSALLYTEYALEMSNLDIYFKNDIISVSEQKLDQLLTQDSILVLLIGFALGLMVASFLFYIHHYHKRKKKK